MQRETAREPREGETKLTATNPSSWWNCKDLQQTLKSLAPQLSSPDTLEGQMQREKCSDLGEEGNENNQQRKEKACSVHGGPDFLILSLLRDERK